MSNTYTALHYHIVFSTKNRYPWITSDIEERVWAYMGGIARENEMRALQIGGIDNHAHILLSTKPTIAVSKVVQLIKGGSSKWIHETFPQLHDFQWQVGYGAFSVSKSVLDSVAAYIENQRKHHVDLTFQFELLALLKRHEIEYDEKYLWD